MMYIFCNVPQFPDCTLYLLYLFKKCLKTSCWHSEWGCYISLVQSRGEGGVEPYTCTVKQACEVSLSVSVWSSPSNRDWARDYMSLYNTAELWSAEAMQMFSFMRLQAVCCIGWLAQRFRSYDVLYLRMYIPWCGCILPATINKLWTRQFRWCWRNSYTHTA